MKYFQEHASEYHVIVAGSLLGTYLAKPASYPVGKVSLIDLYPFSFDEFLYVRHHGLYQYYSNIVGVLDFLPAFHKELMDIYKEYLIVGGMPECVVRWISDRDAGQVTTLQNEIITLYQNDFTKHNGEVNAARIIQVFNSIPSQLAKENTEKFVFSAVRPGGRARDFKEAIEWLKSAGIITQLFNVSYPQFPLKPYELANNFKLFLFDTGLLKHQSNVPNSSIITDSSFSFMGQMTENYCLQQLMASGIMPNFYGITNEFELDFLLQLDERLIPIEAKAGIGKRANGFKRYIKNCSPELGFRINAGEFRVDGQITNLPLYLIGRLPAIVKNR